VYKTTKRIPTGETPFPLACRTEAIIDVDICIPTLRTEEIDRNQNIVHLCLAHDQLEER